MCIRDRYPGVSGGRNVSGVTGQVKTLEIELGSRDAVGWHIVVVLDQLEGVVSPFLGGGGRDGAVLAIKVGVAVAGSGGDGVVDAVEVQGAGASPGWGSGPVQFVSERGFALGVGRAVCGEPEGGYSGGVLGPGRTGREIVAGDVDAVHGPVSYTHLRAHETRHDL